MSRSAQAVPVPGPTGLTSKQMLNHPASCPSLLDGSQMWQGHGSHYLDHRTHAMGPLQLSQYLVLILSPSPLRHCWGGMKGGVDREPGPGGETPGALLFFTFTEVIRDNIQPY
ncbi:Hypothetical predicted protein [Marmota monax]|uniref:Uncharacterized protein n=1 Tax=Marmota monax TaxID=9995 RepID=A0A5E4AWC1_MARMO|nr:hypothetical protein GHT09_017041 [Marmota monax]VTJ61708.1 Hypothetical predicted protein [Marmota monax]